MGFNGNAITNPKFVNAFSQGGHDPGVFMAGDKIAIRRLSRQGLVHQRHVGAAARTGFDFQQDFHESGFRCGHFPYFQLITSC
jgi:hypothetical protein